MHFSFKPRSSGSRQHILGTLTPIALVLVAMLSSFLLPIQTSGQTIALASPVFSTQRGFFSSPFSLILSSAAGTSIRYTLDGSTPSASNGTLYAGPITVAKTTVVRAVASSAQNVSPVATNTYLFLADVRTQSETPPPGWPSSFAKTDKNGSYPADYGMDPEVWNHPTNTNKFDAVMKSLPSLSIVTDLPNLWDAKSGIYYNAEAKEPYDVDPLANKWERPISLEWINPDGTSGFAETGGLRINGQSSRRPYRTPKKSFKIYFKAAYGTGKLDFKLFDDTNAVTKFDRLVLRNGGNRIWPYFDSNSRKDADYVNDEWARQAWTQMGNLAPHGTFVHLYLDGQYWGLYNLTERIDAKFIQAYEGGNELDYDVIEDDEDIGDYPAADSGTIDAYNELLGLVSGEEPITDAQYKVIETKVDVENLADYFVHVHYIGKVDWPYHNWNTYRKRTGADTRFKFIPWDNDSGLNEVNENITQAKDVIGADDSPSRIFARLTTNAEFRQVLADRLYRNVVSSTGKLTPTNCAALYTQLMDRIDQAVIGESGRWGDYTRDVYPRTNNAPKAFPAYLQSRDLPAAYTDPTGVVSDAKQLTWLDVKKEKLIKYCPGRSNVLIGQYVTNNWYQTTVKAPLLSQFGGAVKANADVTISNSPNNNVGTIYYTTNGSDPRAEFGAVATSAQNGGNGATVRIGTVTNVKARVRNGTTWSPLVDYTFYPPQPFENLVINELHYNPVAPTAPAGLEADDYEFIELYNKGDVPLRLDNAAFTSGVTYTFPTNTTIAPKAFLVLSSKNSSFESRYGFKAFGDYRNSLANGGEVVELTDAVGNLIDSVAYLPNDPWPVVAAGSGKSLSLREPTLDNSLPANWFVSFQKNGSPGAPNDVLPPQQIQIGPAAIDFGTQKVNQTSTIQSVTLLNNGAVPVQITDTRIIGDFAQTNTCPAVLAPDESCIFKITFSPTAEGARTGSLLVTTSAASEPETVALGGTGSAQSTTTNFTTYLPLVKH